MADEGSDSRPADGADPDAATRIGDEALAETELQSTEVGPAGEAPTRVRDETVKTEAVTTEADEPGPTSISSSAPTVAGDAGPAPASGSESALPDSDFDPDAPTRVSGKRPIARGEAQEEPDDRASGIAIGSVLFGEYEIIEVLGAGGMGEVYKARHRRLDEPRAIKMMHADLSKKKGANAFFLREARALLAVRNSAVVHCHDLLSDEEGRVFLIMEMIDGISLADRMKEGPLSPDEVVVLGARLASGLSAAHRCGVVHRDVSPDNVVLPDGDVARAKLIDFGIAKILQEGEGTIVDGFKGKLGYASPEQLGFFGGKIDGRSDFYSLGLVLCAAALGRPMGMGTTVMEAVDARRHLQRVPDEVPIGLRSSIESLLALDPDDRPKRVERLFVVPGVEAVMEMDPPPAVPASAKAGGTSGEGSARAVGFVSVAAGIAILAGIGAFVFLSMSPRDRAAEPAAAQAPAPEVTPAPTPAPEVEKAKPVAPKAASPAKPVRRAPSALDRVRIVGLLRGAEVAMEDNRLQLPKGDNAYENYREVLEIDPGNAEARQGLMNIASRYLVMARSALTRGDLEAARGYLGRASTVAPQHPEIAEVRTAIGG